MNATPLEASILHWIANTSTCDELRAQAASCRVISREFSGAGSYTEIEPAPHVASIPDHVALAGATGPIQGPDILSVELPAGASVLFWLRERRLATLEIAGQGILDSHPNLYTLVVALKDGA